MLLSDRVKDAAKLHHPPLEFNRLFKVSYAISIKKVTQTAFLLCLLRLSPEKVGRLLLLLFSLTGRVVDHHLTESRRVIDHTTPTCHFFEIEMSFRDLFNHSL